MTYDRMVILDDIGRSFTAKAQETISGGQLVSFASGTDVAGSVATTYAWDDITVKLTDSTSNCVGIAQDTVTSGTEVKVYTQGLFVLPAGSNPCSGGELVIPSGYGSMVERQPAGSVAQNPMAVGRALTNATALTGYAITRLNI